MSKITLSVVLVLTACFNSSSAVNVKDSPSFKEKESYLQGAGDVLQCITENLENADDAVICYNTKWDNFKKGIVSENKKETTIGI